MGEDKGGKLVKDRWLVAREGFVEKGRWAGDEIWELINQLN